MKFIPALLLGALLLGGCVVASAPVYRNETFSAETPYAHWLPSVPSAACEAGRRALLSQGYQVDSDSARKVQGSKAFQPGENSHIKLEISLVCSPNEGGSTLYANARQTSYALKASGSNTGVSVAGVGSISLPWTVSGDNLVKVGEETITDGEFYARLFLLIDSLM